jgi:hypothetical protein
MAAGAPLHFLYVGPTKDVTMCNWQFMVCLGACCALIGAALGEKCAHGPEWDTGGSLKNQQRAPSSAAAPLHFLCVGPTKDVTMCNWQFMVCLGA